MFGYAELSLVSWACSVKLGSSLLAVEPSFEDDCPDLQFLRLRYTNSKMLSSGKRKVPFSKFTQCISSMFGSMGLMVTI